MTSPSETIAKAMEGVTPGDWHDAPGTTTGRVVLALKTTKAKRRVAALGGPDREANAAYIAACSPARMREVLDELYALRETALKAEAMEREMAELRALLSRAEEYIIDGVTNAKADAEMNAAYPSRAIRYNAALEEVRQLHADVSRTLIQGEKK